VSWTRIIVRTSSVALITALAATAHAQTGVVVGRVVDARTDQPLARVLVHIEQHPTFVETDESGAFTISLPPGKFTISATLIGYAAFRHIVDVASGESTTLVIELSEGAGSYEEHVTVAGAMGQDADRAPAGVVLHGRDLQALRGVMLDDPLRAVQALPSATSTDDFYSEFAVRGNSFRHLNLAIDGIPSPYLIHTIHGVTDGGSIAMVNSEALGAVALLPGSYPQRIGRRLGGQIDLTTRDGNRERFHGRAGLSGTSVSFIGEGPLAGKKGAWMASARRSYLDYLLKRIDPEGSFGFGFSDALAKLTFDINPRNQIQMLAVLGRSAFDEGAEDLGRNDEARATSRAWLSAATWRATPSPQISISQRVYVTGMTYRNSSKDAVLLDAGSARDVGWRADAAYAPRDGWLAEFGGELQRMSARNARKRTFDGSDVPAVLEDYHVDGRSASAYAQVSARLGRATVIPGARIDHWGATGALLSSPWITSELVLAAHTRLRVASGLYRQFPGLTQLHGLRGHAGLKPESARHVDVALSRVLAGGATVQLTGFAREERDVLRVVGAEPRRRADGSIELGRGDARWSNRLTGRARGVEVFVRRDAATGVSGWIAYAYARHRYDDVVAGEEFWSDFDQRHTFSAYGLYRVSNRTTVGAKFRYGSNYPITGYVAEQRVSTDVPPLFGGNRPLFYGLANVRNTLRLPVYARLDLRADRAVSWFSHRVTLFVEVANALNRRNERNVPYSVDRNGRVGGVTDSLLPIVPSGGFVIEF
jgi:hypothetical protein